MRVAHQGAGGSDESAPMNRWDAIVGQRGQTYWWHVQQHVLAMLMFALGVLCGAMMK